MRWSILPREVKFFELFSELGAKVIESSNQLRDLVTNYVDVEAKTKLMKQTEHEADLITHRILDRLNKSFVTPLERDDIRALAQRLDDVLDDMEHAGNRMLLFGIVKPTDEAKELVAIICKAAEQIAQAVDSLQDLREVQPFLVEINRLENQADDVSRRAIGKLFHEEKDLRELIRWKEMYEQLERVTDRAEDVADTIEDIVVKNA